MLVLVRHGESTANAQGLLLGRSDTPLTDLGVAQARAVANALSTTEVVEVRSSPLQRALRTAEMVAGELPVIIDDRWVEVDYGEHEGRPLGDVPAEVWQHWRTDPTYRPEGGEALAEVGERVAQACNELFAQPGGAANDPETAVVVVSHVSPIKAAVAWAIGGGHELAFRLYLATGSITRVKWGQPGPVLHTYNEVPFGGSR
jgi:probable phosphoglycerate mutase